MSKISEPDDVDLFVGGIEPDANASVDTARFIEEYKNRPDYHVEAEEAERIIAALGVNVRDYGMTNAQSLLDHWRRCIADLQKADTTDANVGSIDQERRAENGRANANFSTETQH
jgi:hypothetical protein